MTIGYKVLGVLTNNELCSASIIARRLAYAPGMVTVPDTYDGPLAVFSRLRHASAFAIQLKDCQQIQIWGVAYTPSIFGSMWKASKGGSVFDRLPLIDAPPGTVLADAVTPLKRMF